MSLFKWFAKKSDKPAADAPESSGLEHADATQPYGPRAAAPLKPSPEGSAANRKGERLERRELLYAVVRECMTQAGLLSSTYKFKVLSLDSHGRQYLIMADLPREHVKDTERLAEIESLIARSAKAHHDILVTAVYWRVNDHVTAGLTRTTARPAAESPATARVTTPPARPVASPAARSAYEPIQADELAEFKRAAAGGGSRNAPDKRPTGTPAWRRGESMPQFADTQIDDPTPPLGPSQYGDLN